MRRGYRPTPFWSKMLFRYNLLCDNCNWEFTGFAVPGTVSAKPTKNPKKKTVARSADISINSNNSVPPHGEESAENQIELESPVIEETRAVEKSLDAPLSPSVPAAENKAKRKSGV